MIDKKTGINKQFWKMQGMAEPINDYMYRCKICDAYFDANQMAFWIRHRREENIELTKKYIIISPVGWEVKIHLMGCVEREIGSNFRKSAHAHNRKKNTYFGWLCFKSCKPNTLGKIQQTVNSDGTITIKIINPSALLRHEYGHLLAPNQSHNETFKRREKELKTKYTRLKYNNG